MPKSIVPSPAAVVAVDRLTLQATDARATDNGVLFSSACGMACPTCFFEE
jgi:uncharacterized radical SAM superfamily Fe-S cluster-containing enzyme